MMTRLNISWRRVLGNLLGVLGFSGCFLISCTKMYGCPSADYKLVGDVKDVRTNPIPGIRVVFDRYPENEKNGKDTLYTDAKGHFERTFRIMTGTKAPSSSSRMSMALRTVRTAQRSSRRIILS